MNQQQLCIYEDAGYSGFGPLTDTRAVWDLRCGALTLGQKLIRSLKPSRLSLHVRSHLAPLYLEDASTPADINPRLNSGTILFVNGRALLSASASHRLLGDTGNCIYLSDGDPVAFRLSGNLPQQMQVESGEPLDPHRITRLEQIEIDAVLCRYPWDLIRAAGDHIRADLELSLPETTGKPLHQPSDVIIRGAEKIVTTGEVALGPGVMIDAEIYAMRIDSGVRIGAGAILDSSQGPVWLDEGVVLEAGAIIAGPVYIGPGSIVRSGARLSRGVCLGPQSRVGGEINNTIIQGYTSKQHSGYLGNSYLGSWINFGAATDTSDLKNNYRSVVMAIGGEQIDTGELHIGSIIGDFTRTAIHQPLNTGTVVGVSSNLFGLKFPARQIPPFTWFGTEGYEEYRFDSAIETIRTIMPRRGQRLTPALEGVLKRIFEDSAAERKAFPASSGNSRP